jgi:hypothetical protein
MAALSDHEMLCDWSSDKLKFVGHFSLPFPIEPLPNL